MDITALTKEQKQETVKYIIGESRRFNCLLRQDYYQTEVRRYCMKQFKCDPGQEYANLVIDMMIFTGLLEEEYGRIKFSRKIPSFRKEAD